MFVLAGVMEIVESELILFVLYSGGDYDEAPLTVLVLEFVVVGFEVTG